MIPSQPTTTTQKPRAEVVVEGELSPFEHEVLYRTLRKSLQVAQPSYKPLEDEEVATRVNLIFHYPYNKTFFSEVLRESWRELKDLAKQVSHRRGKAGAAFNVHFLSPEIQIVFRTGMVSEREAASAFDQIGHLTPVINRMLLPETTTKPVELLETSFDRKSDTWEHFRGYSSGEEFAFDDSTFRWVPAPK